MIAEEGCLYAPRTTDSIYLCVGVEGVEWMHYGERMRGGKFVLLTHPSSWVLAASSGQIWNVSTMSSTHWRKLA